MRLHCLLSNVIAVRWLCVNNDAVLIVALKPIYIKRRTQVANRKKYTLAARFLCYVIYVDAQRALILEPDAFVHCTKQLIIAAL